MSTQNTDAATIIAPSKPWDVMRRERSEAPAPMSREQSAEARRAREVAVTKTIKDDFDVHNVLAAIDAASEAEVYAGYVSRLYLAALDILLSPWYQDAARKAGVLNPAWHATIIDNAALERRGNVHRLVMFDLDGVRYVGLRYAENAWGRSKAAWDTLDQVATTFMYKERIPVAVRADLVVTVMRAIPEGAAGQLAVSAFDADKALETRQRAYIENTAALEADSARLAKLRTDAEALASMYPDILDALARNLETVNARIVEARKVAFSTPRIGHKAVIITEEQLAEMVPKPIDGASNFKTSDDVYEFAFATPVGTKITARSVKGPDFVG